ISLRKGARTTLKRGSVEPDATPGKIGKEDVEPVARDTQLAREVVGELLARFFVFVRACGSLFKTVSWGQGICTDSTYRRNLDQGGGVAAAGEGNKIGLDERYEAVLYVEAIMTNKISRLMMQISPCRIVREHTDSSTCPDHHHDYYQHNIRNNLYHTASGLPINPANLPERVLTKASRFLGATLEMISRAGIVGVSEQGSGIWRLDYINDMALNEFNEMIDENVDHKSGCVEQVPWMCNRWLMSIEWIAPTAYIGNLLLTIIKKVEASLVQCVGSTSLPKKYIDLS
ncbi:hypothetical protein BC937DRAFT_89216, partial [Endogone sp. FLAS-F59071]